MEIFVITGLQMNNKPLTPTEKKLSEYSRRAALLNKLSRLILSPYSDDTRNLANHVECELEIIVNKYYKEKYPE